MKYFFEEITQISTLPAQLERETNLTQKEIRDLLDVASSTAHHKVLDALLMELDSEKKVVLLKHVEDGSDPKTIMSFLREEIKDLEEKISRAVLEAEKDLLTLL